MIWRARRLQIDLRRRQARYSLLDGEAFEIVHHGQRVMLEAGPPALLPIPPAPTRETPAQPSGRGPLQRRPPR